MPLETSATERVVLLLAIAVAVSGVVGSAWIATSASTPDSPQIDANAGDRYQSVQGVEGTRTTAIERNGTVASERTYSVELRPGTGEKQLSLVEGPESRYARQVSNGSVLWLFERDAPNVTRVSLTGVDAESTRGERIGRLFARLDATTGDGTPDEPPTVEPLPVVPGTAAGQQENTAVGDRGPLAASYEGTATVADRTVHVVHLRPVNDSVGTTYEQTLWIDAEHYFPLQQRTAWTRDGERTVQTTTYTDVEFDPGLGDDAFAPDVPANTTVRSPETPETTTYRDVGALAEATDVPVPEPDVPPTYELAYATRTDGRVEGVGLRYVNRTSVLTVAKYNFTYAAEPGEEQVTIDGQTAELTRGRRVTLSWNCGSYRYTVRATALSTDAVVEVGESVGCPGTGR